MSVDASSPPRPLWPGFALPLLTARLAARFFPQLVALALAGVLARSLLLEASVRIGFLNHLAGLVALTSVVLVQLVVTVAMFETLRPGLPALAAARDGAFGGEGPPEPRRGVRGFVGGLTLALVPFFGVYAAWGFLGDAVRDYSKLMLELTPFGEKGNLLDVSGGAWLAGAVGLIWAVRHGAKALKARSGAAVWDVLIVVCEAAWAFIGLYVLSGWKDEATAFAAGLPEWLARVWGAFGVGPAGAAPVVPPPVETVGPGLVASAQGLFFYALYPAIWLTLAAIVYGYDVHGADEPQEGPNEGRAARALARWRAAPGWLRDFVGHFVDGTLKRYRAIANDVRLTFASGVTLIVGVIVLFRLIDWLAAWAWYGAAQAIGPHPLDLWQIIASGLALLLGSSSAPGDGVLTLPLKYCLLAAALEIAFAGGRRFRRR